MALTYVTNKISKISPRENQMKINTKSKIYKI